MRQNGIVITIAMYVAENKHDEDFTPEPATEPTGVPAGSMERIEVYRARIAAGESLWHSQDSSEQDLREGRLPAYTAGIREIILSCGESYRTTR